MTNKINTKGKYMDDFDAMMPMKPKAESIVLSNPKQSVEYTIYLQGAVKDMADYTEHYLLYQQALENDVIYLHINCPGGSASVGLQYIYHMEQCAATIVGLIGNAASIATAIAMTCDSVEITEFSEFLVHSCSYEYGGTEHSVANMAAFISKQNKKFMDKFYTDFLTQEEMDDALKGVDILLDSDQLKERFEKLYKKLDIDSIIQSYEAGFISPQMVVEIVESEGIEFPKEFLDKIASDMEGEE